MEKRIQKMKFGLKETNLFPQNLQGAEYWTQKGQHLKYVAEKRE